MAAITDLLFNPGRFYAEKMAEGESLRTAGAIVLLLGVISGLTSFFVSNLTVQLLPAEAQSFGAVILAFGFVVGVLSVLVMWLVWTVVFTLISSVLGGSGTFRRTLEFVGYGMLPQVFGGVISAIISFLYFSTVTIPSGVAPEDPQEVILGLLSAPMMQFAMIVGILFLLWSANLWIFGMKEGRRLTLKNAVVTVGIPVAVYLIYTIYSFMRML